jgi:hypothetical protein
MCVHHIFLGCLVNMYFQSTVTVNTCFEPVSQLGDSGGGTHRWTSEKGINYSALKKC